MLSLGIQHTVSQSSFLILTASKNKSADDVFIPSLIENKPHPYFIQFQKVILQVKIASWHQEESSLQRNGFQQSPSLRPNMIPGRILARRYKLWSFSFEMLQTPEWYFTETYAWYSWPQHWRTKQLGWRRDPTAAGWPILTQPSQQKWTVSRL